MARSPDVAVIGGGVVGLALARRIATVHADVQVTVFDKEPVLARHASGRNSGVLHAGFSYTPDSLKARLTRAGNALLHEFCAEHGVPVRRCGKVVVATDPAGLPQLDELARRAAANGVVVELVDEAGLAELEPLARSCGRALWSPATSSADPVQVVEALAADARRRGVDVRLAEPVLAAAPGVVRTAARRYGVGHVVNCAGLHADRVARMFGMGDDYLIVPFQGRYRYLAWPAGRLRRHVYPVPDPRYPFLGVHLTVTVDGRVKVGPTATPVLGREQYSGLRGLRPREAVATAAALARFVRRSPRDSWQFAATEFRLARRPGLAAAAARLVPAVTPVSLAAPAPPGIRAQLVHRDTGELEMDFVVRGDDRSTHVLNAVSPAWTSALAVAEHVVAGMPL